MHPPSQCGCAVKSPPFSSVCPLSYTSLVTGPCPVLCTFSLVMIGRLNGGVRAALMTVTVVTSAQLYWYCMHLWGIFLRALSSPVNSSDLRKNYYKVVFWKSCQQIFFLKKNEHYFSLAARKNNHHYENEFEEMKSLIYQFYPVYTGNISSFQQCYMFDWKSSFGNKATWRNSVTDFCLQIELLNHCSQHCEQATKIPFLCLLLILNLIYDYFYQIC